MRVDIQKRIGQHSIPLWRMATLHKSQREQFLTEEEMAEVEEYLQELKAKRNPNIVKLMEASDAKGQQQWGEAIRERT